jgi:hypothetical protein
MTPADERIVQLLAKWQKSLELHTRYTRLSDDPRGNRVRR